MHHIHTHYDNLQLTQNATDAEIRQAYRRLSKKYHPDLSDDPDAHRIMQIVNRAYEVLSNPQSRAEHDKWITMQYLQQQQTVVQAQSITYYDTEENEEPHYPQPKRQTHHAYQTDYFSTHQQHQSSYKRILMGLLAISVVLFGLVIWQGWGWLQKTQLLSLIFHDNVPTQQVNVTENGEFAPTSNENESYTRPNTAPNGNPFPEDSNYVEGYPVISGMGNGKLVIENVRNSSDVFAQLYEKNSPQPIRTFFILERDQMTLNQLDAGKYFVRYYQLDNGEYLDSESISLVRNQSATIYLQRGKAPQNNP